MQAPSRPCDRQRVLNRVRRDFERAWIEFRARCPSEDPAFMLLEYRYQQLVDALGVSEP